MDDIPGRIEHTVLGPLTAWEDVTEVLDAAVHHGMRACVPPCYVDEATDYASGVAIATVIGFPHGQHSLETKCTEANQVWKAGAAEIDLVPNLGRAAAGEIEPFEAELEEIAATVPVPVKAILEAPLFDDDQLRELAAVAASTDIDFLKTATGFTEGGATVSDVELLSEYDDVKASGGIGSWAFAKELFDAGADRIGASSGDVIVDQYREQTGRE
ncbi:deoxyribose-phosphate aldolase [Halobacteriaceae archaeon SHR40]|uniref:deoxyribose-phosphate aldolase n=1 Tax=Halovenus amylolytica TaxID=2500550 RepID=UPI000FE3232C